MKNIITTYLLFIMATSGYSQQYISHTQAMEDIDMYHQTLFDVHYNPFLFIEKEDYNHQVNAIKTSIKDSIIMEDFIQVLYKITALIEDSHTGPAIFQGGVFNSEYKKEQFFPIPTIIHNNHMYVSPHSTFESGIEPGSEIIAINSLNTAVFLSETQTYIGGIPEYKQAFTNRLLSHFLFISGIKAPFDIKYKDPSGTILNATNITGVSYVNALKITIPGLFNGNSFKIIDEKLGYIDFCNMSGSWEAFGEFLDTAFATFKEKNIKHVAIDLRNNSGGNSVLGDLLLSYITNEKYKLEGIRKWKISKQYKDYLTSNGNTSHHYLTLNTNDIWVKGDCEPMANNFINDSPFAGKVYFLTGSFTFSSGNMVAAGVKAYNLAEIIGQPTGENTNDFGEVYSFTLPHSKLLMNTSTSFDIGPDCDETISSPVIPDVVIENSVDHLLKGEDKTLKYVLEKAN